MALTSTCWESFLTLAVNHWAPIDQAGLTDVNRAKHFEFELAKRSPYVELIPLLPDTIVCEKCSRCSFGSPDTHHACKLTHFQSQRSKKTR